MDEVTCLGYTQVTCLGCRRAVPYWCADIEDSKPVIKGEGVSVTKGEGVSAKAPLHSGKGTRNEDERDEGDDEHWQQRAREIQQHREKLQNA
jgi:hypothetical protein